MKRWRLTLLLVAVIVGSACFFFQQRSNSFRLAFAGLPLKTSRTLKHADRFILFSLEPYLEPHSKLADKSSRSPEKFHGFLILGKTEITDKTERKQLLNDLFDCIPTGRPPWIAMCFNPRHGIRAIRNGENVDLLICFECGRMYVFASKNDSEYSSINFDRSKPSEFNRVLKAADVKLPDH
jgi:hypothetical protein